MWSGPEDGTGLQNELTLEQRQVLMERWAEHAVATKVYSFDGFGMTDNRLRPEI
jgi:hypothetical protein